MTFPRVSFRTPLATPSPPQPHHHPQSGIAVDFPAGSITRIREFQALAWQVERDGHMRQQLLNLLKLSKDKWEEARDHALSAVVPDNMMRAWYLDRR